VLQPQLPGQLLPGLGGVVVAAVPLADHGGRAAVIGPAGGVELDRDRDAGRRSAYQLSQSAADQSSPMMFRIGTGDWVQASLSGLRVLAVPRCHAVAQLFRPVARYSAGRLAVTCPAANTFEVEVTIPDPPAVLSATLLDAGATFTLSDKGKYAQTLLDRAPGLPEMLLRPGTLEVIAELTCKRTDRVQRDLETFR
jgi:hypothetical protein